MKKIFILLFFCTITQSVISRTTKGKEFWVGFMENLSLSFNGPPSFKLHISSDVTTSCTVSIPFTGYTSTFVVNSNQVYVFTLPSGNFYPQGDEAIANNGIKIAANDSIEVKAFHHRMFFTESTIVLPLQEIGVEYLVMAQADFMGNNPCEMVILATQNNTTVEIIPSVITIGTRPAGLAFSVTLQSGQMYQLQSFSDLTGTSVKSIDPSRKIAVFGGARQAIVGCSNSADDHIYDQAYPLSSHGKKYHVVPFSGHISDVIKVLATQNNTSVTVTGGGSYSLNKGQYASFSATTSCEVNSNNPIAVSQLATSQGCNGASLSATGDPGMINLVQVDLTLKKTVFRTPATIMLGSSADRFPLHRLNIVVKTSAIGNLKLDNIAVPSNSFNLVAPNSNYSYTRMILDTLSILQHTLTCDSGFNASIYCFTFYNFYGHHLGYHNPIPTPPNTTGLHMKDTKDFLKVFPLPAVGTLNIQSAIAIRSIGITDLLGRQITGEQPFTANEVQLNISELPEGLYYCLIQFVDPNREPAVVKFIKSSTH